MTMENRLIWQWKEKQHQNWPSKNSEHNVLFLEKIQEFVTSQCK